ncbi:hypothetical protein HELRODRAFT_66723, partial [Helobdella robusta]|uniref:Polyprenal reductase n=1 Tax=Helobdella robusta TaxID=6412 RepID=T1FYP3_HELRO
AFTPFFILFMMAVQCWRRYEECVNTSIFSHSTINLFHFMTGVFVYSTFPLSILTQAIAPENNSGSIAMQISCQHILGFLLFCIASFTQRSTHKTLAELRLDNKTGKVKDLNHHVPKGWMFKHVSCPHYLCEIFIYCSFCLVDSFGSEILNYIFLFVIVNQIVAAHMNHTWYKKTFKYYPKDRKAIIPFIF